MDIAWHFPASDRAAREGRAAEEELRRRTGREFYANVTAWPYKRGLHVNEDEVLRHHPDLCEALNVFPCADGCNRAAVRYCRGHRCAEHYPAAVAAVDTEAKKAYEDALEAFRLELRRAA